MHYLNDHWEYMAGSTFQTPQPDEPHPTPVDPGLTCLTGLSWSLWTVFNFLEALAFLVLGLKRYSEATRSKAAIRLQNHSLERELYIFSSPPLFPAMCWTSSKVFKKVAMVCIPARFRKSPQVSVCALSALRHVATRSLPDPSFGYSTIEAFQDIESLVQPIQYALHTLSCTSILPILAVASATPVQDWKYSLGWDGKVLDSLTIGTPTTNVSANALTVLFLLRVSAQSINPLRSRHLPPISIAAHPGRRPHVHGHQLLRHLQLRGAAPPRMHRTQRPMVPRHLELRARPRRQLLRHVPADALQLPIILELLAYYCAHQHTAKATATIGQISVGFALFIPARVESVIVEFKHVAGDTFLRSDYRQ
ncbi:hypothetical protein DFH09DRAFT_1083391 [Mycena vulgaris]|nr:hypothetical protein DFH09DRAFT_1083391 [Mycena vulgaris]